MRARVPVPLTRLCVTSDQMNLFSSCQPKLTLFEGKNNGLVIATEGRVPGDCASPEPLTGFPTSAGPSGRLHKRSYTSEQRRTTAREEQNCCCWGSDTYTAHLGARSVCPGSGLVGQAEYEICSLNTEEELLQNISRLCSAQKEFSACPTGAAHNTNRSTAGVGCGGTGSTLLLPSKGLVQAPLLPSQVPTHSH